MDTVVKPYTAEDLNRDFATGHWGPKSGLIYPPFKQGEKPDGDLLKPPLWERWPECCPADCRCVQGRPWQIRHVDLGWIDTTLSIAGDLCVMGVVKAAKDDGYLERLIESALYEEHHGKPWPHAIAIAGHRLRDAVEARG